MSNTTLEEPAHASLASLARGILAVPTDLRIEELARRERVAVRRRDWVAARVCVVERAELREARHRNITRRRA